MIHTIKVNTNEYEKILDGKKEFVPLYICGNCKEGDYLGINEYDEEEKRETGRFTLTKIKYIEYNGKHIKENCEIIGFEPVWIQRKFTKSQVENMEYMNITTVRNKHFREYYKGEKE